jgi:hypothetical protein
MNQYLSDSEKFAISGILSGGNDAACDSLPPMEEIPSEGPRFPYAVIRDRINGCVPPAPRHYSTPTLEDDDGTTSDDDETILFCEGKQGFDDYKGLGSSLSRNDIRAEFSSMGLVWGE